MKRGERNHERAAMTPSGAAVRGDQQTAPGSCFDNLDTYGDVSEEIANAARLLVTYVSKDHPRTVYVSTNESGAIEIEPVL